MENSLIEFTKEAWPQVDSAEFQPHWSLEAICQHLEAVKRGDINKLLINVPYRFGKTTLVSIIFPAWVWAQRHKAFLSGPGVRFLCASYNSELSLKIATDARKLIESDWYQERWGRRFAFEPDQNTKHQFDNTKGGRRQSTSVSGSLLGFGGECIIVDDPHKTGTQKKAEFESDAETDATINWWKEMRTTRLNDAKRTALVVVMQRLKQNDISGNVIAGSDAKDWTQVCIPMEYQAKRHAVLNVPCVTVLKRDETGKPISAWKDPRTKQGELAWPERWGTKEVELAKTELGPTMASGRLQQNPEPPGGGLIKRDWWQPWTESNYPKFSFTLAVLDTAFTEKTENDPSALTIWGFFGDPTSGAPRVMLVYAWEDHQEFHALLSSVAKLTKATKRDESDKLPSFSIDRLVIENKANGISIGQEFDRVYGHLNAFPVELVAPEKWGDKIARVVAVQGLFSEGMIYAPGRMDAQGKFTPLTFAQKVIDQMAVFPYSKTKDLTDTASMALLYMRTTGLLERTVEFTSREADQKLFRPRQPLPYQV